MKTSGDSLGPAVVDAQQAAGQTELFPADDEFLLIDATGTIAYFPALLSAAEADAAFRSLHETVPWKQQRRPMYGREVEVPRLTAGYALDDATLPDALPPLVRRAMKRVPAPFNSVGLNLYRNGNDSVAPHNDHLHEIAPHQPIALLSLGATRTMVIRARQAPRRSLKVELTAGSLLVMSYATQLHYDHGVPRQRGVTGARISLALRVRQVSRRPDARRG